MKGIADPLYLEFGIANATHQNNSKLLVLFIFVLALQYMPIIKPDMHRAFFILFMIFALTATACEEEEEYDCEANQRAPVHYRVDPRHFWLMHYKVGDSLAMKVYRVEKKNDVRVYTYLRDEMFVATDSSEDIRFEENSEPCKYADTYWHDIKLEFKGRSQDLTCRIIPETANFTYLQIQIHDLQYNISAFRYDYRGEGEDFKWYEQLSIGGKEYSSVNSFKGRLKYTRDNYGYIDSSYTFYNYEHGILKLIVNDTLAYIKEP